MISLSTPPNVQIKAFKQLADEDKQEELLDEKRIVIHVGKADTSTKQATPAVAVENLQGNANNQPTLPTANILIEVGLTSENENTNINKITTLSDSSIESIAIGEPPVGNDTVLIEIFADSVSDSTCEGTHIEITSVNVQAQDIEALYHAASFKTGFSGTAITTSIVNSVTLLLKNGLAYLGLTQSPLDLPLNPQQDVLSNWAPWRRSDSGDYEIQNRATGKWNLLAGTPIDTSPVSPEAISGCYAQSRTQTWGNTQFSATDSMTLTKDGRFMISTSSHTTSGTVAESSTGETSISIFNTSDKDGSSSIVSSLYDNGEQTSNFFDKTELVEALGHKYGEYKLLEDGVTLEMQFANGDVERKLFLRTGKIAIVNNSSYNFYYDANSKFELHDLLQMAQAGIGNQQEKGWVGITAKAELEASKKSVHAASISTGPAASD